MFVGLASGESDLELLRIANDDWAGAVRELRPDAVVLDAPTEDDLAVCRTLLLAAPETRFLALGAEGKPFLYLLVPTRKAIGDLSRDGLLRALRTPYIAAVA